VRRSAPREAYYSPCPWRRRERRRMKDRRLETLLRRAEESVAALRAYLEEEETPSAAWFGRMGGVLSEIEDRGGEVSVEDLREIGIRHGYDPRGMGGFLSGLSPSLERDHPDRRVRRLTVLGKKRAAHWRDLYGQGRSARDPGGKRQT
jgi:hypothetical protein